MEKILNRYVYSQLDLIGQGAYGKVYKGKDIKTQSLVAIKILNLQNFDTQFNVEEFKKEMNIMKSFNHPNIVKLYDYVAEPDKNIVILEHCDGDLSQFIDQNGQMLNESTATQILIQLVNGFKEINAKNIIHRDVKPANILIKNGIFKIADFGFATKTQEQELLKQQVGTPLYMSPQLLEMIPYSSKSDIWSLGIIAFEMIYGKQPWACRDVKSYLKNIKCYPLRFPIEKTISEQYKDFVRSCLKIEEKQRIDWNQLSNHPLIDSKQFVPKTYKQIQIDDETKQILKNIQYFIQNRQLNIEQQFKINDKDNSGQINLTEFYTFITNICSFITPQEAQIIFQLLDKSQDNLINIKEFQELFCNNDFSDLKDKAKRLIEDLKQILLSNNINIDEIFAQYDIDNEGDLKINEFIPLITKIFPALKPKEIALLFNEFDKNHDGQITFIEFKQQLAIPIQQSTIENKQQKIIKQTIMKEIQQKKITNDRLFKIFDSSRTNKLNLDDFTSFCREMMNKITEDEIQLLFKIVDINKDNLITQDEFNKYFQ